MVTDKRQFGFKKEIGYSCYSYVKKIIDNFVNEGSTVTFGCLDFAKAFDKYNHFGLLRKLLEVKMPFHIVNMLSNWFSKVSTQVLWDNCLSSPVRLECGLHQGSVLSPALFSLAYM